MHEQARRQTPAFAASAISQPLPELVSNNREGPPVPRASRLTIKPTLSAQGLRMNARTPIPPASSPSVKRKTTSFFKGGPALSARAVSSRVATPAPSSAAPGPKATES